MKYSEVNLVANMEVTRLIEDINRILRNTELPDNLVHTMWKESQDSVTKKFNLSQDNPYHNHLAMKELKRRLVEKLSEIVGPAARIPLSQLHEKLIYI